MLVDQLTGSLCNLSHWLTQFFSSVHRHQNEPTENLDTTFGARACYLQDRVDAVLPVTKMSFSGTPYFRRF